MYGRLQSRCSASADALTVAGFLDRGRDSRPGDGRAINGDSFSHRVPFLQCRDRIARYHFRRHSGPCPDLPLANPVANDPEAEVLILAKIAEASD
jgi:hypothetical protein